MEIEKRITFKTDIFSLDLSDSVLLFTLNLIKNILNLLNRRV